MSPGSPRSLFTSILTLGTFAACVACGGPDEGEGEAPVAGGNPKAIDRSGQQGPAISQRLAELQRLTQENGADTGAVLAAWRAFQSEVRGTDYFLYASDRIAELETPLLAEAQDRIYALGQQVRTLRAAGQWDEARLAIESFPAGLRHAWIPDRLQEIARKVERDRELGIRCVAYFVVAHGRLETGGGATMDFDPRFVELGLAGKDRFTLFAGGQSELTMRFVLQEVPSIGVFIVFHLAANRLPIAHAPITIRVNDRILLGDWSPEFTSWYGYSHWDIARFLVRGENSISWRLGNARTQYWVQRAELWNGPFTE